MTTPENLSLSTIRPFRARARRPQVAVLNVGGQVCHANSAHPGDLTDLSLHPPVRKRILGSAVSTLAVVGALALSLARAAAATSDPDPTLLPVATTAQVPLASAYNALGVPSLAAGASYRDPTTGARIY